jgi:hypothetical protein
MATIVANVPSCYFIRTMPVLLNIIDMNFKLQRVKGLVTNCGMNRTGSVLYSIGHLAGHEAWH